MPNHVHLVLTPADAGALSRTVGEAHRRFTAFVNARARTTGHLFQARFASFVMDDAHFLNALRYLAFNPVRAGLAVSPEGWPWSSVRAHLQGRDDALVQVGPALERAPRFADLMEMSPDEWAALLPPITFPSGPERRRGDEALKTELDSPKTALE
jgi:putative transposase